MKINLRSIYINILFVILACSCEKENNNQPFPSSEFIQKGSYSGVYWPTEGWRTCDPEAVGMDPDKLKEVNEEILLLLKLHIDINSVLIIKNGYIVAEQYYSEDYNVDSLHSIYSCTKSITSALIGIAINQEYISDENEQVTDFFPEYNIENLTSDKRKITLRHMLTMSTGFDWKELDYLYEDERNTYRQWVLSDDRIKFVLDRPMVAAPGAEFSYSTGISHVLSAIIKKSTGMRTDSFALKNIFKPLGIERYYWSIDMLGVASGGNGVRLMPRDMGKLGYLYLKNGMWDGKQVVPQAWVEKSQKKLIKMNNNTNYYYGYHWWVNDDNSYSAVGYGGQWIKVFPEHDLVVVFTNQFSDGDNFQRSTPDRLVESYILPSIK